MTINFRYTINGATFKRSYPYMTGDDSWKIRLETLRDAGIIVYVKVLPARRGGFGR